jgi:serine/threonine-protein kinase
MGFWSRLRREKKREERPTDLAVEAPVAEELARGAPSADLERLVRVGLPEGPSAEEALATFRALRATAEEGRAVEEIVRATGAARAVPEELVIAAASALVDRGEPAPALRLLEHASASSALLMRADLFAEKGDLPGALAVAERVLLRDLDHPGARERHRRWRAELGFEADPRRESAGTTTVVAREPDAPFLLLREVARGGAGAVYEAEDRDLGRRVALKVYHQPGRDRAQLEHEARVAAELAGPGVVRVFDIDPEHGWIALEWTPLGALRDRVRAKDRAILLPIQRWAMPLAEALARAHAADWVHNDVKPANVLLATDGSPLLADFGIARRGGEPSPPGSLGYVSPERMRGRPSAPRDDIYGFGRILEDVLDAVADAELRERFRPIAAACVGPDDGRPADARALVTRVRVEG